MTRTRITKDCERVATLSIEVEWTGLQIANALAAVIATIEHDRLEIDTDMPTIQYFFDELEMPTQKSIEDFLVELTSEEGMPPPGSARESFVRDWHVEIARQHLKSVWPDVLVTRGIKTLVGRDYEANPNDIEAHRIYLMCWAQPSYDEPYWTCLDCGTSDYCDHSPSCAWVNE